ncbi:unnamed protein product, partial [Mycena citricolor]
LHSLRLCLIGDRYWSYLHCAVLSATLTQPFSWWLRGLAFTDILSVTSVATAHSPRAAASLNSSTTSTTPCFLRHTSAWQNRTRCKALGGKRLQGIIDLLSMRVAQQVSR